MSNERRYLRLCIALAISLAIIVLAILIAPPCGDGDVPLTTPAMVQYFKSLDPADNTQCMAYTFEVYGTPDGTHSLIVSPPLDDNGRNRHFNLAIHDVDNNVAYIVNLPDNDVVANFMPGRYGIAITNRIGDPMARLNGHIALAPGRHFRISFVNVWCDDILPELEINI